MKLIVLAIIFLAFDCFAKVNFEPDFTRIRKWDQSFYSQHIFQPFPKIVRFQKTRTLTFVATKHKDWKNSQTLIFKAIKNHRPDILLIEGIGRSDGVSPRIWDEKIKQNLNVEGFEGYYAYKLALEEKIPFIGAELEGKMSDHSSFERDKAVLGYTAELLENYRHVMIVYGAGHYVQQEAALIEMLGKPEIVP